MKTITMPSFGADMATGTLAKWKVKAGEAVNKGDIIATIETMKGLIDMEVFDNGVIASLLAGEGEELNIGDPIAELRLESDENSPSSVKEEASPVEAESATVVDTPIESGLLQAKRQASKRKESSEPATMRAQKSHLTQTDKRLRISPAALKRAIELGVDWRQLADGNGPAGALVLKDIDEAYKMNTSSISPPTTENEKPSATEMMRQAIAATVSRSKREIPHYYLQLDILLNPALDWLNVYNANLPPSERILMNAVLYSAIARSLSAFPSFNGFYQNEEYKPSDTVNLGNAISLRTGGIIIPAIPNAQQLGLVALMDILKDQVMRAKKSELRMSEVQNATVTVSNLGDRGTDSIQSIIFPPQVAIFGIGRTRKMPWIIDDAIVSATIVSISLAADHRVSDGHSGARLLNHINKLIQNPEKLL